MNIVFLKLYITEELNNKFYNSQELGLAKALLEMHPEHRVDIILLSKSVSSIDRTDITNRLSIIVVPAKGFGHHGRLDLSILKEMDTELVHLMADNMIYAPDVIRYCINNGIKCHLYIGTLFTDSKKWYMKTISRFLMTRNIRAYKKVPVYTKTPKLLEECNSLGIKAKLATVGMNLEDTILSDRSVDEIRLQYNIPLDKKILLFVGRLEDYKHPLDVVKLMNLLDASYHLMIIGRGVLEAELEKQTMAAGLTDRVTRLNSVPNKDMRDIFKACDYYVNFNPDEIYGMAILEAMCHRCPVFAITAPGPDYLIDSGKTGFVCNTIHDMADRILELGSSSDLYSFIQNKSREKVLNGFIWNSTVQCFEDF